jgi:hypothetical protein
MTGEFEAWFRGLHEDSREAILRSVYLLEHEGPALGRPHADTLHGSMIANLKELRTRTGGHQFRILYRFDRNREALLIVGDDKKGREERRFYRRLIARAEKIIAGVSTGGMRLQRKESIHGDHQERGSGHGAHPPSGKGSSRALRGGDPGRRDASG